MKTGRPEILSAVFPAVPVAILLALCGKQWFGPFAFLFPVPLLILFFSVSRERFTLALSLTLVLDFIINMAQAFANVGSDRTGVMVVAFFGSVVFFVPLFWFSIPGSMKIRYRLVLAGSTACVLYLIFFIYFDTGARMVELIRTLVQDTVNAFYTVLPENFEADSIRALLTPDKLFARVWETVLMTMLPSLMLFFAIPLLMAHKLSSLMQGSLTKTFSPVNYYNDPFLFLPLCVLLTALLLCRILGFYIAELLLWNATLVIAMLFFVQGFGILRFFLNRLIRKTGIRMLWVTLIVLLLVAANGWVFFALGVSTVGVVELFVPLRRRFTNIDTADPTPGDGGDHN